MNEFIDDMDSGNSEQNLNNEHFTEEGDNMGSDKENISITPRTSSRIFSETVSRLEKISVAPGEKGNFQNWGEDVFLEEKCFPELFPFGIGGYLSKIANVEDTDGKIGFAAYVKHRIMSADPKYRKNSSYVFFLLLVKELIQLKRCKQTYMRQATKAPNLTKETMLNINPQDLSRYNRSYEVFKTMRGTSMYFEEAKRTVMATLRQNGSPSLFLTLSCAEYAWTELLREIFETVKGGKATEKEFDELTQQQRNKLISENVVQSTLHFQKRIEKELKLMTFSKFFDDDCPFSVSSYFYRIEFQQRGAPHVHCLLWLEDDEGNPAPTFWSSEDEDATEEKLLENKVKRIENIAMMLISGSIDSALCDKHHSELQNLKKAAHGATCKSCFTAKHDFVECPKHRITHPGEKDCQKCLSLKELAKKFQTHRHTFTCKKKRKTLSIRGNEGHGRQDGKIEGDKISGYVECRFNFPQFPLNRTMFIPGMSKDISDEQVEKRKTDLKKIKKFLIR